MKQDSDRVEKILPFLKQHAMKFAVYSELPLDEAVRLTAEELIISLPHEAGHAVAGLSFGAGDILEFVAVMVPGQNCGGCSWGRGRYGDLEKELAIMWSAGMAGEELRYGVHDFAMAEGDREDIVLKGKGIVTIEKIPQYITRAKELIESNQAVWECVQERMFQTLLYDLEHRVEEWRNGKGMGVVSAKDVLHCWAQNNGQAAPGTKPTTTKPFSFRGRTWVFSETNGVWTGTCGETTLTAFSSQALAKTVKAQPK